MRVYTYLRLGHFGRLANQLWEVAATVSMARRFGGRAWIPQGWEYRPYLRLPDEFFEPAKVGDEVIDVATLEGGPYHQSLQDIAEVQDEIRDWFSPSDKAEAQLRETRGAIVAEMDKGKHFSAAHVRRTDYIVHSSKFRPLTPAYYLDALAVVSCEHPDTQLLVFSDDVPWCRANAATYGFDKALFIEGHVRPIEVAERIGEPLDVLDLFLMARCDAHVIANSSFSWWAAFLSGSTEVFHPDRWFGPTADNYETMWDCIPEGWIKIAC